MTVGLVSFGRVVANVGRAQINISDNIQSFINLFKRAQTVVGTAPYDYLDGDGYPIKNFVGRHHSGIIGTGLPSAQVWLLTWGAGRSSFAMYFQNAATSNNPINCTVDTVPVSSQIRVTGDGVHAGSCELVFNATQVNWAFDENYTSWANNTGGEIAFIRKTDLAKYNAGQIWTDEHIAVYKGMNLGAIRTMGWDITGGLDSGSVPGTWAARPKTTNFSWNWNLPGEIKSGGVTSFNSITCPTNYGAFAADPASTTDLTQWVDGEAVCGQLAQGAGGMQISGVVSGTGGNCQVSITTIPLSGNTHTTTTIDGITSTTGVFNGMAISGTGIPVGATIASFTATTITLSVAATSTNSGVSLVCGGVGGLVVGNPVWMQNVSGTVELNNTATTILAVDGTGNTMTVNIAFVNAYSGSGGRVAYQTFAINGKSGGSKLVYNPQGFPMSTGGPVNSMSAGPGIFVYSAGLDGCLYNTGIARSGRYPTEAKVQLCNLVNADLWSCVPMLCSNDYILQEANLVYSLLQGNLKYMVEWSNEVWNSGGGALPTFYAGNCAYRSNLAGSGLAFLGLRIRMAMSVLSGTSSWKNATSRLRRLYMIQGGASLTTGGVSFPSVANNMMGALLTPTWKSSLNAQQAAYVGGVGVDYSTTPNRPIDFTDAMGYAPYVAGLGLQGPNSPDTQSAPTVYDAPNLQVISDNYVAGNTATAITQVDNLIRNGRNRVQTVTASGTTFTTPSAHNFAVNDLIRFDVSGGTSYSGVNTQKMHQILTTPLSTTFTCASWTGGNQTGGAITAGSAGSGTQDVGGCSPGGVGSNIFAGSANRYFAYWQNFVSNAFTTPPANPVTGALEIRQYEGGMEPSAPSAAQLTAVSLVCPSTPVVVTGTTHGTTTVDGITSTAGIYAGMVVSAADITTSQTVVSVATNSVVLSAVATGSNTETVTFTGTSAIASTQIDAAIAAWRNDPLGRATQKLYLDVFSGLATGWITFGAMPNSVSPSNLVIFGSLDWALLNNTDLTAPSYRQTYYGFADYSASGTS